MRHSLFSYYFQDLPHPSDNHRHLKPERLWTGNTAFLDAGAGVSRSLMPLPGTFPAGYLDLFPLWFPSWAFALDSITFLKLHGTRKTEIPTSSPQLSLHLTSRESFISRADADEKTTVAKVWQHSLSKMEFLPIMLCSLGQAVHFLSFNVLYAN